MTEENTLFITERSGWRDWLEKNFSGAKEIWLVYPGKSTGKKRILYNDAVEEALCFGWIDSNVKTLDKDHVIQRFTPRKRNSNYSQANKERLKWLLEKKKIHSSLVKEVEGIVSEEFKFPPDIINAINKDKRVLENYNSFSEAYKRIRIAYIDGARNRPEEFNRRLTNFIKKTGEKKLIKGHGGIDKYY